MLISTLALAADPEDDISRPFAARPDDPAFLKSVSVLREIVAEARSLGFSESPLFDEKPLKSIFYPSLGFSVRLKEFQLRWFEMVGQPRRPDGSIYIQEDGLLLRMFDFNPPVKPQGKPFVPNLLKEEALKKCQGFLALLTKGTDMHLNENEFEFVQHMNHANRSAPYQRAYWRAHFQRVSRTGIPVMGDMVSVWLDERFGLILYQNECHSQVSIPDDEKPSVSAETASKEAVIFAQRVKDESPLVKSFFGRFTLEINPAATVLMICQPTDLLTCSNIYAFKRESKAVLVWLVQFKLTDPKPQNPKTPTI